MVMVTFFSTLANAQDKPEMADVMRSNGKIYDVVAVCLTILIGLFIYVFIIDRKISKIEKNK
jgi:tetrahydromethanopterin S-methyltransferase subunit D